MAWEKDIITIPGLVTGVDLSGKNGGTTAGYQASAQFLFAKLTADITIGIAGLADCPLGIIQNNAPAGTTGTAGATVTYTNVGAAVRHLGVSKLIAGTGGFAFGQYVGPDANGAGVPRVLTSGGADAGRYYAAYVLEGAAVGELGTVLLLPATIIQA